MRRHSVLLSILATVAAAYLCAQNPATTVSVDAAANRHPIHPYIYGIAYGDAQDMKALNAPLNRWGGNSTTRYNWQIDAHSAAADWYFETYSGRERHAEPIGRPVRGHDTLGEQRRAGAVHDSDDRLPGESRSESRPAGRIFGEEVWRTDRHGPVELGGRKRGERRYREGHHGQ